MFDSVSSFSIQTSMIVVENILKSMQLFDTNCLTLRICADWMPSI